MTLLELVQLAQTVEEHRRWRDRCEHKRYFSCRVGGKERIVKITSSAHDWCYEVKDFFSPEETFTVDFQKLWPIEAMGVARWLTR